MSLYSKFNTFLIIDIFKFLTESEDKLAFIKAFRSIYDVDLFLSYVTRYKLSNNIFEEIIQMISISNNGYNLFLDHISYKNVRYFYSILKAKKEYYADCITINFTYTIDYRCIGKRYGQVICNIIKLNRFQSYKLMILPIIILTGSMTIYEEHKKVLTFLLPYISAYKFFYTPNLINAYYKEVLKDFLFFFKTAPIYLEKTQPIYIVPSSAVKNVNGILFFYKNYKEWVDIIRKISNVGLKNIHLVISSEISTIPVDNILKNIAPLIKQIVLLDDAIAIMHHSWNVFLQDQSLSIYITNLYPSLFNTVDYKLHGVFVHLEHIIHPDNLIPLINHIRKVPPVVLHINTNKSALYRSDYLTLRESEYLIKHIVSVPVQALQITTQIFNIKSRLFEKYYTAPIFNPMGHIHNLYIESEFFLSRSDLPPYTLCSFYQLKTLFLQGYIYDLTPEPVVLNHLTLLYCEYNTLLKLKFLSCPVLTTLIVIIKSTVTLKQETLFGEITKNFPRLINISFINSGFCNNRYNILQGLPPGLKRLQLKNIYIGIKTLNIIEEKCPNISRIDLIHYSRMTNKTIPLHIVHKIRYVDQISFTYKQKAFYDLDLWSFSK
ncbi:hypothetical protein nvc2_030 [Namao virus]|nr:hypothetical protein nvc2_030 [Namao virus]